MNNCKNIFISYARKDAEAFAEKLCDSLEDAHFKVWWDKTCMQSRGRTFLHEIQDAIENCDILIAVVTPEGVKSEYVRMEWEHAFLYDKIVVPVLYKGEFNLLSNDIAVAESLAPENLNKKHCPDFRDADQFDQNHQELVRILNSTPAIMGNFKTSIPCLPRNLLPRRELFLGLIDKVMGDGIKPITITSAKQTTSLQGMGGIGKSVLASALCRSSIARRHFKDGIFFLTFGEDCTEQKVEDNLRRIISRFGQKVEKDQTPSDVLSGILEDKQCLLVLDDVWNVKHVAPFKDALGKRSRIVVTTRDKSLADKIGVIHEVELLTEDESLELLARWSNQKRENLPEEALQIAIKCGYLPLALAMAGATARDNPGRWKDILEAFKNADYQQIQQDFPNYPYPDVFAALQVGLDALDKDFSGKYPGIFDRYLEFAVYPEKARIPEKVIRTQWQSLGFPIFALDYMESRSLLMKDDRGFYFLHDTQRSYLIKHAQREGKYVNYQKQFIECYRKSCHDIFHDIENDGYFYSNIGYHLNEAGEKNELEKLLSDIDFLVSASKHSTIYQILADFSFILTNNKAFQLLEKAIRFQIPFFHDHPKLFLPHLYSYLYGQYPEYQQLWRDLFVTPLKNQRYLPDIWLKRLNHCGGRMDESIYLTIDTNHNKVVQVLFISDNVLLLALCKDGSIGIWDSKTGKALNVLNEYSCNVSCMNISKDGAKLIFAYHDNSVKIFNANTFELIKSIVFKYNITSVAFSNLDNRLIAGTSNGLLILYDLDRNRELTKLSRHEHGVNQLTYIDSCDLIISLSNFYLPPGREADRLVISDRQTGELIKEIWGQSFIESFTISRDEKLLIIVDIEDTDIQFESCIRVYDITNKSDMVETNAFYDSDYIRSVDITNDNKWLISASDSSGLLKLWNIETAKSWDDSIKFKGHFSSIESVAFSSDCQRVLSGDKSGKIKVWDVEAAKNQQTQKLNYHLLSVNICPNKKIVVCSDNEGALIFWDVQTGKQIDTYAPLAQKIAEANRKSLFANIQSAIFSPDGEQLVCIIDLGHEIIVYDMNNFSETFRTRKYPEEIKQLSFTNDNKRLVSIDGSGIIDIWDINSGKNIGGEGHFMHCSGDAYSIAVSPDITHIAVGTGHGTETNIWIFNVETGKMIKKLHEQFWRIDTIAFSPNGINLVSGSADNKIRLWDISTDDNVKVFQGHTGNVRSICFSPCGKRIVSGGYDNILLLWDADKGTEVTRFYGDSPFEHVCFSRDGQEVLAADLHHKPRIYDFQIMDMNLSI